MMSACSLVRLPIVSPKTGVMRQMDRSLAQARVFAVAVDADTSDSASVPVAVHKIENLR